MTHVPVLRAIGNNTITIATLANGDRLIRDATGSVTIPASDVDQVRIALADFDAAPRLVTRIDDTTPHRITDTVWAAFGNDGKVALLVGSFPCATVEIEVKL